MSRKNLIGILLVVLGAGLYFYSQVILEDKIFNIFLHNPNQLLVDVPLQTALKQALFLQTSTKILGIFSVVTGLITLLAQAFSRYSIKKSSS